MGGKIRSEGREETEKEESHPGADEKAEPVEKRTGSVEKDQVEFFWRGSLDNPDISRRNEDVIAGDKKNNAGGAMTGKVSPSAVLVIQNGTTKLVNIKNQDTVTKILDMVPDVVDKFTSKIN